MCSKNRSQAWVPQGSEGQSPHHLSDPNNFPSATSLAFLSFSVTGEKPVELPDYKKMKKDIKKNPQSNGKESLENMLIVWQGVVDGGGSGMWGDLRGA